MQNSRLSLKQESRFFRHLKGFKIFTSQVSILSKIMKDIHHQEKKNKTKQTERHKNQRSKERVVAQRGTKSIPRRMISEDSRMITMGQAEGNKSTLQACCSKGLPAKFPAVTLPSFLNLRKECPGEPGFGFYLYLVSLDLELMEVPPLPPTSCYLGSAEDTHVTPLFYSSLNYSFMFMIYFMIF